MTSILSRAARRVWISELYSMCRFYHASLWRKHNDLDKRDAAGGELMHLWFKGKLFCYKVLETVFHQTWNLCITANLYEKETKNILWRSVEEDWASGEAVSLEYSNYWGPAWGFTLFGPVIGWKTVLGIAHLLPVMAGIVSSIPVTFHWISS